MIRKVFLMLGLTLISGSSAWAIPQTLNFQGFLKESGSPVTGTRDMTFGIYAAQSGGSSLFSEAHTGANTVTVSTGIFNALIGDLTSGGIPLSVFDGSDRYVEVVVGATTLPRQKITSVANAFIAATASNLSANAAINISSAVLTATGSNQFSLQTSSGINVQNGGVTAPFFSGTFTGNGAGLTGLNGTDISKVAKTGDTMTGPLTLAGSTLTVTGDAFSVGVATLTAVGGRVGIGTSSPTTKLHLNSGAMTIDGSGAGMNVAGPSTATYFYGDGSNLTGVADTAKVSKTGDTMTGQLTLSGSTLTVTGNAFSVGGTTLAAVGGRVGIGTSSPATKLHLNSGAMTIDGSGAGMTVAGPSTATYFYGDGSNLTGVADTAKVSKTGDTMTGQLTLSGSTLTVTGNAFSVGGSSFSVGGGSATVAYQMTAARFSGIGTALTALTPANISGGTLGSTVIASSVAASGVGPKSTCGSASVSCSFDVNVDGRITRVSSATISAATTPPTRQILLTGTGTYTRPTSPTPVQIRIRMVGGGGGGGATYSGGTSGSNGTASSFGSITANYGLGGGAYGSGSSGGVGGSGGAGGGSGVFSSSSVFRWNGGAGGAQVNTYGGGTGGSSFFGGGGAGGVTTNAGGVGAANSGAGGGGGSGGGSGASGSGGGAGEGIELIINSPAATYSYAIGAGGAGGTGGSAGGGAGASGVIIVDEYY